MGRKNLSGSRGTQSKMQRSAAQWKTVDSSSVLWVCISLVWGLLSGMIFDRIRFDESRTILLNEIEEHTQRLHQRLMAMEREGYVYQ